MKLIAFLGETYIYHEGNYYATQTSGAFLQKIVGENNIIVVSPSTRHQSQLPPRSFSSKVNEDNFISAPRYSSTKNFIMQSIFKKNFYRDFVVFTDEIIKNNPDAIFWIRTPSIGSVIFGLRVIKYNKKLINHMCADIKDTWRDKKYSLLEKCFGFIISRILRYLLRKICSDKKTINLATGSALESFGKQFSANTYQFVDLMSENIFSNTSLEHIKNFHSTQLTLTFVGRLVEDKGIFDLLSVMTKIPSNIKLNIVGCGSSYENVLDFIKKHKLENRIIVHGQLAFTELDRIYRTTDLTIVPSNNYYEGFPRVIMESWSYGIPVIVSNVGGVAAFVKDNVNGFIFKAGDIAKLEELILHVYNDEKLYSDLKIGAISMAEISTFKYWSNVVHGLIYKEKNDEA
ncbi:glycosyltransferase [Providencia alcalifaciens]|uniref:WpaB n=1 Tax=Providencia alcalifaciens TaxID=126385 RepID=F8RC10_9GAMM|nr:glycosyltransferase [Providencia alcalifaciens]AEB61517.1 WpaB [Providencia alcalifaciens]MTC30473.1 glycosyltransferase [Providencia alcalifaciens]